MSDQERIVPPTIIVQSNSPRILKLVPASRVPRLRYHGVEPGQLAGVEVDVYLWTDVSLAHGRVYEYAHTRKIEGGQ